MITENYTPGHKKHFLSDESKIRNNFALSKLILVDIQTSTNPKIQIKIA